LVSPKAGKGRGGLFVGEKREGGCKNENKHSKTVLINKLSISNGTSSFLVPSMKEGMR
jgi:hypothetical protein